MKNINKLIFMCLGFLLIAPFGVARANLEINEIMYNLKTGSDDGREWIEVYNNSTEEIDLSALKFFEGDTNHKLQLIQGSPKIPPVGYALIVADSIKFKADWPSYSGTIFDSTFSLSNNGELLAIKEITKDSDPEGKQASDGAGKIIDQYTYSSSSGGAGDGNSLQKINGVWKATMPTPGVENSLFLKPKIAEVSKPPSKLSSVTIASQDKPMPLIQPIEKGVMQESTTENSWLLFVTSLIGLIIAGSGVSYYIRRRNRETNHLETASDFEILE